MARGWPKGVKRKRVEELREDDLTEESKTFTMSNRPFSIVLGVRHLGADDKFPGLWQLVIINPDGTETIVIDATTKGSVTGMAQNAIARCL